MASAAPLPRGRHGLTPDEVLRSQRERILRAMAEAVAERGYANTAVADVLGRARVSRATFYEQYQGKQDCFLDAYDSVVATLLSSLGDATDADGDPLARIDAMLERYLATLADKPALARTFLIEVYAAGPGALRRRAEVQGRFARAAQAAVGARTAAQRFACELLVGAVSAQVTQALCRSDAPDLRRLRAPLMRQVELALAANGLLR